MSWSHHVDRQRPRTPRHFFGAWLDSGWSSHFFQGRPRIRSLRTKTSPVLFKIGVGWSVGSGYGSKTIKISNPQQMDWQCLVWSHHTITSHVFFNQWMGRLILNMLNYKPMLCIDYLPMGGSWFCFKTTHIPRNWLDALCTYVAAM